MILYTTLSRKFRALQQPYLQFPIWYISWAFQQLQERKKDYSFTRTLRTSNTYLKGSLAYDTCTDIINKVLAEQGSEYRVTMIHYGPNTLRLYFQYLNLSMFTESNALPYFNGTSYALYKERNWLRTYQKRYKDLRVIIALYLDAQDYDDGAYGEVWHWPYH